MELGIHFANFTLPGGPAAIGSDTAGHRPGGRGGRVLDLHPHGPLLPDGGFADGASPCSRATRRSGSWPGDADLTLALLVTGVTYRHPGLLAKIVTTLDVRVRRAGAARYRCRMVRARAPGLGVPFPPVAERFERLEETLQIGHQMWSDDDGPYNGRTTGWPRPLFAEAGQKPAPKILIGGSGERRR